MVPVQVDSWAVAAVVVDEVVVVVVVAVVAEAVEMEPAEITFFISIYVVCLRCARSAFILGWDSVRRAQMEC